MPRRPAILLFLTLVAITLTLPTTAAQAQVGQRNFYSALITEGADPDNDLTISPGWVTVNGQLKGALSYEIEKTITDTTSLMLGNAISDASRRRLQTASGADNMEILAKWAFYTNGPHEFRSSIAFDVYAPTGDIGAGAGGHWRGGPMLLMEKGAGDLPDSGFSHYLRPFGVQLDTEYLPRWTGAQLDIVTFDSALSYQLDYLDEEGFGFKSGPWLKPLVFFNEFNYQQQAFGFQATGTTPPDWRVTPGIAYATPYYQFAGGVQLGLNKLGSQATHNSGLFQIDIYYDQIFPALGKTL